jgi:hypothetical protein
MSAASSSAKKSEELRYYSKSEGVALRLKDIVQLYIQLWTTIDAMGDI